MVNIIFVPDINAAVPALAILPCVEFKYFFGRVFTVCITKFCTTVAAVCAYFVGVCLLPSPARFLFSFNVDFTIPPMAFCYFFFMFCVVLARAFKLFFAVFKMPLTFCFSLSLSIFFAPTPGFLAPLEQHRGY